LQRRFEELNTEIDKLHEQQKLLANLLQNPKMLRDSMIMTKERWVHILESSGYSENDMRKWHDGFERISSESHNRFLKYLGLAKNEIREIRSWVKKENPGLKRLKDQ